jgi:hemerythrin-like domain-containing protein
MAVLAEKLEDGGDVEIPQLENIVEFLRTYADRCHHGKEEALLFPALQNRGVPSHGCPLGGLTMEHQKGRGMVGEFAEAIRAYARNEPSARASLVKSFRDLTAFYPNHIWKEDYLLFPLAARLLSPEDNQALAAGFEQVEAEIGADVQERLERFAAELET